MNMTVIKPDIIDVYDVHGRKQKMEVVSIFKIKDYDSNYIIYCDLGKKNYYIAKYKGEKIVDLDTNLSEEELLLCNDFFEKVITNE